MKGYNKKKDEQLGMSHGAAANRLRKAIMFELVRETGRNVCFQCGEAIEDIANLSIEHKIPWLDSEDPVGLYFDLGNIAFSHLRCNCAASRSTGPKRRFVCDEGQSWCYYCKKCLPDVDFYKDSHRANSSRFRKVSSRCKECQKKYMQNRRQENMAR